MKNLEKELRFMITELVSPEFEDEIIDGYISPIMNKIENHIKAKVIKGQIDVIDTIINCYSLVPSTFLALKTKKKNLKQQLKELQQ